MICLSSMREEGLWTHVGLNSPAVSTKGHTRVGVCGGDAPRYGAHLDIRKEPQTTRELWEVSLHGGAGREERFLLLAVCA